MVDLGFLFVFVFFPLYMLGFLIYYLHKRSLRGKHSSSPDNSGFFKRPNYRLRMSVFAAVLVSIVSMAILFLPGDLSSDFAYWVGLTLATIYVCILIQFEDVPGHKRAFNPNPRLFMGSIGLILLVLVLPPLTRHAGLGFFTGIFLGLGLGIFTTALTSRQMSCPSCQEYHVFVRFKGDRYCNACGTRMPEPGMVSMLTSPDDSVSDGGTLDAISKHTPAMPAKTKHCRSCKTELVLQHSNVEGRHANVQLEMHNLPYMGCPNGHQKVFPFGEFAAFLLEDIHGSIPKIIIKGLARETDCFNCGSKIDPITPRRTRFTIDFQWKNWDSFSLVIILSCIQCQACRKYQRLSDLATDSNISDALLDAFSNLGLSRS